MLLTLCVVAYWDIASFTDSLKWDMLDCYYPWRQFVAECVQFRVFPFWNPYQDLGYPIYADMRSVFYPEPWIIGLFGGYSLKVFHGIFIFYLAVAGLGMHKLTGLFTNNPWAKVIVASAYVLSGFFVGHGQELAGIIGATWLPWSLFYFLRFQRSIKLSDLFKLAIFLFLLLTGGYQAINIIYVYLLVALGLASLIGRWRNQEQNTISRQVVLNAVLGLLVVGSIVMLAITYVDVSPHVGRLTGLTLQEAHVGYVAPRSLASFIAPYSVTDAAGLEASDLTMQNLYVGLMVLVFFLVGLFARKSAELKIILAFGIICLLASLGPFTPVREWLFNLFPGMNLFRMSSFFSYFTQLAILLVAGVGLGNFLDKPEANVKGFKRSWVFLLLLTIAVSWIGYTAWPTLSLEVLQNLWDWSALEEEMKFGQRLMAHGAYQLALLLMLGLAALLLRKHRAWLRPAVLLVVVLEMVVAVRLNFSATIGGGFNPSELQTKLDAQPKGFPIPDNHVLLRFVSDYKADLKPLYHNTNILTKTISWDAFNSFQLRNYDELKSQREGDFQEALTHPLVYGQNTETQVRITEFGPNGLTCQVSTSEADSITLQQTYFPGWQATVNGASVMPTLVYNVFQRIAVPSGESTVRFEYRNPKVKYALVFAYGLVATLLLLAAFTSLTEAGISMRNAGIATIVFGTLTAAVLGFRWSKTESNQQFKAKHYEALALSTASGVSEEDLVVLQVDDPALMDSILQANGISENATLISNPGGPELKKLQSLVPKGDGKVIYARWNQPQSKAVMEFLESRFGLMEELPVNVRFIYWPKSWLSMADAVHKPSFETALSFEEDNALWNFQVARADSTVEANSGNYSWNVGVNEMGTPPLILRVGDVAKSGRYKLVFGAHSKIPSGNGGTANMYINIERKGERVWDAAINLNTFAKSSKEWVPVLMVAQPDIELLEDDVIKAFVWCSPGNAVYLDDLSLKMYATD